MSGNILLITHSEHVEELFAPLQKTIGDDFDGYRNHVYRVLTYACHFLRGDDRHRSLLETALVYHDIGMWTDRELSYLEPSETRALADNKKNGWGHDPEALRAIIHWHHKLFPYTGPHSDLVNAVRRADWIDATQGLFRKGLPKAEIDRVNAAIPALGFYDSLNRLAADLNDGNKTGGLLKVIRTVYKI